MNISVIGSGAVGKAFGGFLQLAHQSVHLLSRSEYTELKKTNFYSMNLIQEKVKLKISPLNVYNISSDMPKSDLIIISVKTTSNRDIIESIESCIKKNTTLLILQNGIGNELFFEKFFPNHPIITGITTIGAVRTSADQIDIPFVGDLKLAPYNKDSKTALSMINQLELLLSKVEYAPKVNSNQDYKKNKVQN